MIFVETGYVNVNMTGLSRIWGSKELPSHVDSCETKYVMINEI
jgi:hypothetical protein